MTGETTIRQAGMVFAVAVWATLEIFRAQIRDSSVITESGWEQFTNHPKSVEDLMLYEDPSHVLLAIPAEHSLNAIVKINWDWTLVV